MLKVTEYLRELIPGNFDTEVKYKINKMINLNEINWCQNAEIIGSKYKIEGKIVENKLNHSAQTNKINMLSLEIQFSFRSYDTKIQIRS